MGLTRTKDGAIMAAKSAQAVKGAGILITMPPDRPATKQPGTGWPGNDGRRPRPDLGPGGYSCRETDSGSSRNRRRGRTASVWCPLTMSFSASPTCLNATTTRTSTINGGYTCHQ